MPQPLKPLEHLSGLIERITFHNVDNGFCVLRVKVKGFKDLVTVVGSSPCVTPGEYVKCSGFWINDKNHGLQFKAEFIKATPPTSLEGMEKYLGSGLIKGIGPHFAKKLVEKFEEEVFDVIENKAALLSTVSGIGKFRATSISNCWKDQKVIREIMIFLQSHGVGTTKATRIYKTYGDNSIEVVSNNPYILAKDIIGIGFISADKIARSLGIAEDSIIRARAGINHALLEATSEGHCGLPMLKLLENSIKLLEIEEEILKEAIEEEIKAGNLTKDNAACNQNTQDINSTDAVFLTSYYLYEKNIATLLLALAKEKPLLKDIDAEKEIEMLESASNISLASAQKLAISFSLKNKVLVITGGPGTGKTTIVSSIVSILKSKGASIKLCAPTGRAAKRLSETTKGEALTIHRLLEVDPSRGGFKYHNENKLSCNYIVIDEASMVDVSLFYSLLKALPKECSLLIVGDVDQLPSVGAGQVLKDIIDSNTISVIRLTEIFRQAATSKIITNAHLINKGKMPVTNNKDPTSDFFFIFAEQGEDIINQITSLVTKRLPAKFKLHPINDIQVLCPMQRGGSGARSLNIELQKSLNPNLDSAIEKYGTLFAKGDKVMQTQNNYDKEVYNGDIGIIENINKDEQEVSINFYGKQIIYDFSELDELTLSYASTIHKSQGSEYKCVVIPITMQSYLMLKRNLIYTAVTRGKSLVVIVGEYKALAMAVGNKKSAARYTKLREWLEDGKKDERKK